MQFLILWLLAGERRSICRPVCKHFADFLSKAKNRKAQIPLNLPTFWRKKSCLSKEFVEHLPHKLSRVLSYYNWNSVPESLPSLSEFDQLIIHFNLPGMIAKICDLLDGQACEALVTFYNISHWQPWSLRNIINAIKSDSLKTFYGRIPLIEMSKRRRQIPGSPILFL